MLHTIEMYDGRTLLRIIANARYFNPNLHGRPYLKSIAVNMCNIKITLTPLSRPDLCYIMVYVSLANSRSR